MAASLQAVASGLSFVAPANQPLKSGTRCQSSVNGDLVLGPVKSQFFGASNVFGPIGSSKPVFQVRSGSSAIVSASFFEKLGKLFANSPEDEEQVLVLLEFNEQDRNSPYLVKNAKCPENAVGDFVPFSNKVYDCTGKRYLGISAGLCTVVEHHFPTGGDRFETTMSHYVGDYGHLSLQGTYNSYDDSEMAVVGGTGIFAGARGWCKCHNIKGPLKLRYTYHIKGIPRLPAELTQTPVLLEEEKRALNSVASATKVNA